MRSACQQGSPNSLTPGLPEHSRVCTCVFYVLGYDREPGFDTPSFAPASRCDLLIRTDAAGLLRGFPSRATHTVFSGPPRSSPSRRIPIANARISKRSMSRSQALVDSPKWHAKRRVNWSIRRLAASSMTMSYVIDNVRWLRCKRLPAH